MTVCLVTISDGRGYLAEAVRSLLANTPEGTFSEAIMVDDSAQHPDAEGRHHTDEAFDLLDGIPRRLKCHKERRGGAAAIQTAWQMLAETDCDYAFHLEEDWIFPGPVPVAEMIDAIENIQGDEYANGLANVVLRRQPWGSEGPRGYIGDRPSRFYDALTAIGAPLLIHQLGFWLNPCVYPVELVRKYPWPDHGHEHHYTAQLIEDGYEFAVYGTREDEPRALHVGTERHPSWTW